MSDLMSRLRQIEDEDKKRKAQRDAEEAKWTSWSSEDERKAYYKHAAKENPNYDWYSRNNGKPKPSSSEFWNGVKQWKLNNDRVYNRALKPLDFGGDLSVNPTDYTEDYLQYHSDYVRKNGRPKSIQDVHKYANQQRYKDDYDLTTDEDKANYDAGREPLKYQVNKSTADELRDYLTKAQELSKNPLASRDDYEKLMSGYKYLNTLTDYAKYQAKLDAASAAKEEAKKLDDPSYVSPKDFSLLTGTKTKKSQFDIDYLKSLGYDEKTGFASLIPNIPSREDLDRAASSQPGGLFAQQQPQGGAQQPQAGASPVDAYVNLGAQAAKPTPPKTEAEQLRETGWFGGNRVPDWIPDWYLKTSTLTKDIMHWTPGGLIKDYVLPVASVVMKNGLQALEDKSDGKKPQWQGNITANGWENAPSGGDIFFRGWQNNIANGNYVLTGDKVQEQQLYNKISSDPLLNQLFGMAADVAYDPTTYIPGGVKLRGGLTTAGKAATDARLTAELEVAAQKVLAREQAAAQGVDALGGIKGAGGPGTTIRGVPGAQATEAAVIIPKPRQLEAPAAAARVERPTAMTPAELADLQGKGLRPQPRSLSGINAENEALAAERAAMEAQLADDAAGVTRLPANEYVDMGPQTPPADYYVSPYGVASDNMAPQLALPAGPQAEVIGRAGARGKFPQPRQFPSLRRLDINEPYTSPAMATPRELPRSVMPAPRAVESPTMPQPRSLGNTAPSMPQRIVEAPTPTPEFPQPRQFGNAEEAPKPAVRQFRTNTMERTTAIGDDIKKELGFENYTYQPETAQQWQAKAEELISADKQGTINHIMAQRELTPELQHAAATLTPDIEAAAIQAGAGSPEIAFYRQWTEKLARQASESGRNLKAVDTAWVKDTPEGMIVQAQKNVLAAEERLPSATQKALANQIQELMVRTGIDEATAKNIVKKKLGLPVLEDQEVLDINKWMRLYDDAADPYMKAVYRNKAMQIVANKEGVTGREKFRALQRIFMLLNPKTLLTRNPGGNIILGAAENIKDVPGSLIDAATSLITKERTTAINPLPKLGGQAKGLGKGVSEWGKDLVNRVDTSPTRGQLELPSKRIFQSKGLNFFDQAERQVLQLGDRPFYQSAYDGRLAELQHLGRDITLPETIAEARAYALDRVFQNNSALAKRVMQVRDKLGIAGDLLMPFAQTPANVFDKMLDYTPVGLAKAIKEAIKPASGVFNQKLFVDRTARMFTGTGMIALGYTLAEKGLIHGRLNKDQDIAATDKRLGNNAYSVSLGDGKSYTIDWAQPAAGPLILGADAFYAGNGKADILSQIVNGSEGAIDSMLSQSFLQGVYKLLSGYSPSQGIENFLLSVPSQFMPSSFAQVSKQMDPFARETYDPNKVVQAGKELLSRVPVARAILPKKIDAAGNEAMNFPQKTGAGKAVQNFLSPGYLGIDQDNPADKEAMRLYESTKKTGQFLRVAPNKFTYYTSTGAKSEIVLNSNEYTDYQKNLGKTSMDRINSLVNSKDYKAMKTDEERVSAFEKELKYANNYAQYRVLKAKGQIPQSVLGKQPGYAKTLAKMLGCSMEDAVKILTT